MLTSGPLSLYQSGSGVRIWKGQSGLLYHAHGELYVARAPVVGLDSHLADDLKAVCDALGLRLYLNSIDTGTHVPGSRHYRGLAVDCDQVALATRDWTPVSAENHEARLLVRLLVSQGFQHHEGANVPCVLLGAPFSEFNGTSIPHAGHLHISVWR